MEGHNSDSNNDSIPAGSVSSPEPVASTSASAASRAPAPTTPEILIHPSEFYNTNAGLHYVFELPPDAATSDGPWVLLVPSQEQSTLNSISETSMELEQMPLTPFTPEELVVNSKQSKSPRKFGPGAEKDEKYNEKRLQNTEAVRVGGMKNDEMQTGMKVPMAHLEPESLRNKALMQHYETQRGSILAEVDKLQERIAHLEVETQNEMGTPLATENENSQAP